MMGRTHVIIGTAFGASVLPAVANGNYTYEQYMMLVCGLVIGSLLPDLDHPQSVISRAIPIVGGIISRLTRHRGLLHSILGMVLFYLLLKIGIPVITVNQSISAQLVGMAGAGLLVGYGLHIIADMLTKSGVRLFYPLRRTIKIPLFRTGGYRELILRIALIGMSAMQIIALFTD